MWVVVGKVVRHFKNSLSLFYFFTLLTRLGLPALKSPTYSFFHSVTTAAAAAAAEKEKDHFISPLFCSTHTVVCVIKWSQWTLCSITLLFPLLYRTRLFSTYSKTHDLRTRTERILGLSDISSITKQ